MFTYPPYSAQRLDSMAQWALAAAFLFDVFYSNIPDKDLPTSAVGHGIFEYLSYAWLNPLLSSKIVMDSTQVPYVELPKDFQDYQWRFWLACSERETETGAWELFWRFLLREHTFELLLCCGLRFVNDMSRFGLPWLLRDLLVQPTMGNVFIMFCTRAIGALCGNYSNYCLRKIDVRYRSALSATLHTQTLRLGDVKATDGADITILAEVDTQSLFQSSTIILDIWSTPLQAIIYIGGLAYLLPWEALVPIFVIIVRPVLCSLEKVF
jgi:hypothetical protein